MTHLQTLIYCLFLLLYCLKTLRALGKKLEGNEDTILEKSLLLKWVFLIGGIAFICVWLYLPYVVYNCILTYINW
jgi:hypothetical protein